VFCPNCGAEYREGFNVCSACNVPLVKELPRQIEPEFIRFVTVYETGDPAYIAFAKSLFESEGIRYYVKGEGLQDLFAGGRFGTGFNPVIGPVLIQVDEKDVEKAKDILSQIDQGEFELSEADITNNHAEECIDSATDRYTFKEIIRDMLKFIRSLQRD